MTLTTNHDRARSEHTRGLYTEAAPGPPIRRPRVNWYAVANAVIGLAVLVLVFTMALLLAVGLLGAL